jgi:hypothetical protein
MADFMGMFFEVIIAAALFAPLVQYIDDINATGAAALLWALVPVIYVIAVVYVIYAQIKHKK